MSYTINKFNGELLIVLEDGTINTSTSLGLVGRNYVGYGETQNENFVFLLENFANEFPPARPIVGQTWYDTGNEDTPVNLLKVFDGTTWAIIGSPVVSDVAPNQVTDDNPNPVTPSLGTMWLKTPLNILYIWNGTEWAFIGPESATGFGITRARSTTLRDTTNTAHAVILLTVDDSIIGIVSSDAFTISNADAIAGFSNLIAGITLSSNSLIKGNINGVADRALQLETSRTINNVPFDGTQNITIKSSTTNNLIRGDYLTGTNFDGSTATTWAVDATSSNIIGKVVVRNSAGGFAAGTITADLVGNVTGDVTSEGTSRFNIVEATEFRGLSLTGNAFTATRLLNTRTINGVGFNGSSDITITADAATLTGQSLNTEIINSNLTSVGILTSLRVGNSGVTLGSGEQFKLFVDSSVPTIRSTTGTLNFDMGPSGPDVSFISASASQELGGPSEPAIISDGTVNLGISSRKFNNVYANTFFGNATSSTTATTATHIAGGSIGQLVYQTASGTTSTLPIGTPGQVLRVGSGNTLVWNSSSNENLNSGNYINSFTYSGLSAATVSVDATPGNVANKVVARDPNGNFSATMITSGVTLLANPTATMHAATKEYVDTVSFVPRGMINLWYGSIATIPAGWALCDGSNGTPNLRDRFVVGAGSTYSVGATGGSANATLVSHTHTATVADPGHIHNLKGGFASVTDFVGGSGGDYGVGVGNDLGTGYQVVNNTTGITVTNSTEGSSSTNANLPPYYALCYIMKL
jgi:hypothetical protein